MFPYDTDTSPYQQMLQNQFRGLMTPPQQNQSMAGKHTVKVNGRGGAEAYYLPPNSDDLLLDMNDAIVWFVQTDGAGYKTITPYDISVHQEIKQEDRFKAIDDRLSKLEEAINEQSNNGTTSQRANTSTRNSNKSAAVHNDASNRGNAEG